MAQPSTSSNASGFSFFAINDIKMEPAQNFVTTTLSDQNHLFNDSHAQLKHEFPSNNPTLLALNASTIQVRPQLINLTPTISDTGNIVYGCGSCSKTFGDFDEILWHNFKNHREDWEMWCNLCCCGISPDVKSLIEHTKVHLKVEDEKPICNTETSPKIVKKSVRNDEKEKKYLCGMCTEGFARKKEFTFHMKKHVLKYSGFGFSCPVCKKIFSQKSNLTQHMKRHFRRFDCELCDKTFSGKAVLQRHTRLTHSNTSLSKMYQCLECEKCYKGPEHLKNHMKLHENNFSCDICTKTFGFKRLIRTHVTSIHFPDSERSVSGKKSTSTAEMKPFLCDFCGRNFEEKKALLNHIKCIHGQLKKERNPRKSFLCQYCAHSFSSSCNLTKHVRKMHTKESQFRCDICSQEFFEKFNLRTHIAQHFGENRFLCNFCDDSFSEAHSLVKHIKDLHQPDRFSCTVCQLKFPLHNLLMEHLRSHPDNPRPYQCHLCSKAYKIEKSLKLHFGAHTSESILKCNICDRKLGSRNSYTSHMQSHAGVNKCSICQKEYFNAKSLKKHMKSVHLNIKPKKPFACSVCDKEFAERKRFQDHMNLHTGETPYPCLLCGQNFSGRHQYIYHVKTQHGNF